MLFLGHLGIGRKMARPWATSLLMGWFTLGTILPDLIDKSLYYGLVYLTGRHGEELGLISGTRTFGHSGLFLLLLLILALKWSKKYLALSFAVLTHFILDIGCDLLETGNPIVMLKSIFFPLLGWNFAVMPYSSLEAHLLAKLNLFVIGGEIIGGVFLTIEYFTLKKSNI